MIGRFILVAFLEMDVDTPNRNSLASRQ
jgi:hypothetical protein